ncbi:hypothetical protein EDD17DRAFT_1593781 [Pisolithus thermaeus]|nr:hypothetical protein F5141DRAFT_719628 [Pisolithus sp. B1]KAI6122276.1 hypothetical protein EV401DRAFT_1951842 [Pisolithus croceorrhizus]KAI6160967.1 hypothetical protein EDD17DRAFT_1593781 [Pisolithus thermaeus]
MVLVLGFPFELFLYSVIFFVAALVVHFASHNAKFQWIVAIVIFSFVFGCLALYWIVTEPREEELVCRWKATTSRDVEAGNTN